MTIMETINTANDLVAQLTGTLKSRDDMRLKNLQQAASLAAIEKSSMEREQARLTKKYGANSAQASAAADHLTLLGQESQALAADITRASLPVPATEAGKFVVYGRILDAQGKGLSSLKVTATDAKGSALATGSSKAEGVFEVSVPLTQKRITGKEAAAAKKEGAAAKIIEGEAASAPPPTVSFQLVITGSKLQQPYTFPETMTATDGRLAYREIVLPGAAGSTGGGTTGGTAGTTGGATTRTQKTKTQTTKTQPTKKK
jgi:hypothetical protein